MCVYESHHPDESDSGWLPNFETHPVCGLCAGIVASFAEGWIWIIKCQSEKVKPFVLVNVEYSVVDTQTNRVDRLRCYTCIAAQDLCTKLGLKL